MRPQISQAHHSLATCKAPTSTKNGQARCRGGGYNLAELTERPLGEQEQGLFPGETAPSIPSRLGSKEHGPDNSERSAINPDY